MLNQYTKNIALLVIGLSMLCTAGFKGVFMTIFAFALIAYAVKNLIDIKNNKV